MASSEYSAFNVAMLRSVSEICLQIEFMAAEVLIGGINDVGSAEADGPGVDAILKSRWNDFSEAVTFLFA